MPIFQSVSVYNCDSGYNKQDWHSNFVAIQKKVSCIHEYGCSTVHCAIVANLRRARANGHTFFGWNSVDFNTKQRMKMRHGCRVTGCENQEINGSDVNTKSDKSKPLNAVKKKAKSSTRC